MPRIQPARHLLREVLAKREVWCFTRGYLRRMIAAAAHYDNVIEVEAFATPREIPGFHGPCYGVARRRPQPMKEIPADGSE